MMVEIGLKYQGVIIKMNKKILLGLCMILIVPFVLATFNPETHVFAVYYDENIITNNEFIELNDTQINNWVDNIEYVGQMFLVEDIVMLYYINTYERFDDDLVVPLKITQAVVYDLPTYIECVNDNNQTYCDDLKQEHYDNKVIQAVEWELIRLGWLQEEIYAYEVGGDYD